VRRLGTVDIRVDRGVSGLFMSIAAPSSGQPGRSPLNGTGRSAQGPGGGSGFDFGGAESTGRFTRIHAGRHLCRAGKASRGLFVYDLPDRRSTGRG
jgi:hypothetical protein